MQKLVEKIREDIARLEAQIAEKPASKPLPATQNKSEGQILSGLLHDIRSMTADFRQASSDLQSLKPISKMEAEFQKLRDFRASQSADGNIWGDAAREQAMISRIKKLAREVRGEPEGIWC